jgi:mono/diheme cytochrome c family protein/cytochrome c553
VSFIALGLLGCGSIRDEFGGPPSSIGDMAVPPTAALPAPAQDTRPVTSTLTSPPPISGGTLLVTHDGTQAVAADPDRDRVSIVRFSDGTLQRTVSLKPGDEPGRLVEDAKGRVHVALRRGGALVTIDIATGAILARRAVCGSPRGVAYDASTDQVHVACTQGKLVSFPAAGGEAVRTLDLDVDLRDVIVTSPGALLVSRFKSGQLLSVSANGDVIRRSNLRAIERTSDAVVSAQFAPQSVEPIEPAVAWRTLGAPDGSAVVLHQYGLAASIKLKPPLNPADAGAVGSAPPPSASDPGSPYGSPPSGCGGLVQPALSTVQPDGTVLMGSPIIAPVLTVDASLSSDGAFVLLAHAGLRDDGAPGSGSLMKLPANESGASIVQRATIVTAQGVPVTCTSPQPVHVSGQATAVAFSPLTTAFAQGRGAWFAVQTREPATVVVFADALGGNGRTIALGGASVYDTGHELFHRDAGAGIACASCHAEGGEDGRVWRFDPIGDRRTQAVHVGLQGTEPFHWDGDMSSFGVLVDEVMVRRMGGVPESGDRKVALQNWLFSLTPPAPILASTDAGAIRGQAIFESADVGCATCHSGPHLSTNKTVFVGTTDPGHPVQVPSLHGIAFRAPFIHNGCAATLRDRFDPGCGGGDQHGHTSQLSDAQLADLTSYLETL